jgi:hypothetical protein
MGFLGYIKEDGMIAPCLVPVRTEKLHDQSIAIAQRILPSAPRNQRKDKHRQRSSSKRQERYEEAVCDGAP